MHPRFKLTGVKCRCGSGIFIIDKIIEDQYGETRMLFDCVNCGNHFISKGKLKNAGVID